MPRSIETRSLLYHFSSAITAVSFDVIDSESSPVEVGGQPMAEMFG